MEKSMNGSVTASSSNADAFKNTPHVSGQDSDSSIMGQAQPAVDFLKKNFSTVRDSATGYFGASTGVIRSNPFYAMLGAAAIGVGLGMWISNVRSTSNSNLNM